MEEPPRQPAVGTQLTQSSRSENGQHAMDGGSVTTTNTHGPRIPGDSEQPKDEKDPAIIISPSDRSVLTDLIGSETAEELVNLYSKASNDNKSQPKVPPSVKIAVISDKAQRSRVHMVSPANPIPRVA